MQLAVSYSVSVGSITTYVGYTLPMLLTDCPARRTANHWHISCTYSMPRDQTRLISLQTHAVRILSIKRSSRYLFYLVAISTSYATRCTKAKGQKHVKTTFVCIENTRLLLVCVCL
jgi:hypothetical protein